MAKSCACALLFLSLALLPAAEEKKPPPPYRVQGQRHGSSFFPRVDYPQTRPLQPGVLDFDHYHTDEEILAILQGWQKQYPGLVELRAVDQSYEGRDIWQLTLTNRATGADTDKPAMYLEGNRHSGEITGAEAALHFAWTLLSGYGQDPERTRLLDENAYYIRVRNNPDGAALYLQTAQSNRSTVRPHDSDGDGLLDEDPPNDLDGDGFCRQMRQRVGKGKGTHVIDPADPSKRLMKRVGEGKGDYRVWSEGTDDDGDGKYNEDGIGGIDLHRNYPENWRPEPGLDATKRGWTQPGAGAYPLSEPETRSVVLFLLGHPNVSIVQTMDTAVPMHLRPPSTSRSEESMFPEDLALYRAFDSEGKERSGYSHAGDVYWEYANLDDRPFREGEPQQPEGRPLFGHSPDFGYFSFGAIWYGDELWCGGRVKDYDGDGKVSDLEMLRWSDEAGAGFAPWKPYAHPQLGAVEIGGFNPKFFSQNPPPAFLREWILKQNCFNLLLAGSLPRVRIVRAEAHPLEGQPEITLIAAAFRNLGRLPTALKMAERVKIVKPDEAKLVVDAAVATLAEGKESVSLGILAPGEERQVSWKVKPSGKAGEVEILFSSTRGGVVRQKVPIGPPRLENSK